MESNHISIFGVNISSNEHGQVTLLTFDNVLPNALPPMWLHHIYDAFTKVILRLQKLGTIFVGTLAHIFMS